MERYVHLLIIEPDVSKHSGLRKTLSVPECILLFAENTEAAIWELSRKEIGIVLFEPDTTQTKRKIKYLKKHDKGGRAFFLALIAPSNTSLDFYSYLKEGFTDYLHLGLDINTIRAKLQIYKSLYQKDQRIGQLLSNIFPNQVLQDLNQYGRFSPKRVENGVVLFTDFVNFSKKSYALQPIEIVHQLDYYFSKFDEIISRYKLEKIKTIGDAYMALAGVAESNPEPILRSCMAALELRDWVNNECLLALAQGKQPWEIRIGLHSGPLVSGILGSNKMSFDIWGDTVNLAARAEEVSWPGQITITDKVAQYVKKYFHLESRGKIAIKNREDLEEMYFLGDLKEEYCLYSEGHSPNANFREKCGLFRMDFHAMRSEILNLLRAQLPSELSYHDINHTLGVEKSAKRLAKLEGLSEEEEIILLTAVLYHDSGFIYQHHENEGFAIKLAKANLPKFGYSDEEIEIICQIILSTRTCKQVGTLLEKIMSDADHDYFGRPEYHTIANLLRKELTTQNIVFSEQEWIQYQLDYLENKHFYFTDSALSMRLPIKKKRMIELHKKLEMLKTSKALS